MKERYRIETNPLCREENIKKGEHYRISILTAGLLRLEYSPEGVFEDGPTQVVWNRDLGACAYQVVESGDFLEIFTDRIHLYYDKKEFSANGLSVEVKDVLFPFGNVWHYGDKGKLINVGELRGTARTLDNSDGEIPLEDGLVSMLGYALMDDSKSLVIRRDGWVERRQCQEEDLYFWGYGNDYLACIQDFYRLCGRVPMVPRYALGNWWSRYHRYTQESYQQLIERFAREKIPFSVAVIDMDWHLVDVGEKYGSGWTGYTWNRELFPDPERFLAWLHDKGMHVTLNVHPADGVRDYEDAYEKMGEALGMDPGSGLPIAFDVADEKFMEAYFEYLHHPLEKEGVDFWWIDWQQGGVSRLEGMDPLWMLNHYHFLDNARDGKRPMTFSRYAGPGSHRYPVGFSGDTIVSWKSLDFQPYFTASASNIGYSMWSHDIGGHMLGERDDELAGRWVQYGVFSPVMRLHSSNSQFNSKEPWRYRQEIREVMENFLRLRHKMLPYLYTMNHRQYEQGIPVVLPMYYFYPEQRHAYQVPNQYFFGSALVVAAVTTPCIKELRMARTTVWIPEGEWYDIFTGLRYQGGRKMNLYRDITSIPVFAKAGEIIPFQEDCMEDALRNPQALHLHVYTGQDGSFTLYEDDNITADYQSGKCVRTSLEWKEEEGSLVIRKAAGHLSLIPEKRDYRITFWGIEDAKVLEVRKEAGQNPAAVIKGKGRIEIEVKNVSADQESVVYLRERKYGDNRVLERCFEILNRAEIQMIQKEDALGILESGKGAGYLLGSLLSLGLNPDLYGALAEILTA